MTDEDAQTIVYAFVDLVAARNPYIGDASTLPYPKETIRKAFYKHLEHYHRMWLLSEETFRELEYHDTVEKLSAMLVYLDDWHDIDADDKEIFPLRLLGRQIATNGGRIVNRKHRIDFWKGG